MQKSRDTGTDLGSLSSTLNSVHDTLSGGAPPALPPFPHPTRAPSYVPTNGPTKDAHASSIALLQSQLNETQLSLAGHVGKIQDLEGRLAEHAAIKQEVGALREQMEHGRRDIFTLMRARDAEWEGGADGRESPISALLNAQEADDDIEDDSRSINSIDTIREKPTVSVRPNGVGVHRSVDMDSTIAAALQEQNERLSSRLEKLSSELDEAIRLSQALRTQHAEATETIRTLESRITGLEKAVEVNVAEAEGRIRVESEERWHGWRESFEASAKKDRLDWEAEREKLMMVVREWEAGRDSSSSGNESEESGDWTNEVEQSAGDVGLAGVANEGKSKLRKRKKSSRGKGLSKATADGLLRSGGTSTESTTSMESRWRSSKPRSNRGASTVVGPNVRSTFYFRSNSLMYCRV